MEIRRSTYAAMADRFVPLHEFVVQPVESEPETAVIEAVVEPQIDETPPPTRDASAEVRRFRAAVRDAVDVAIRALLCDVAAEVLARELELAPANLEAIVERARARHEDEGIVCVRVHPDEVAQLAGVDVDVVADAHVRRGDALLQVRSGTIDASLGARLADVLDGVAP